MKRPLKFPLKFERGIKEITRKRTTKEALKAFKSFVLEKLLAKQKRKFGNTNKTIAQQELHEALEVLQEEGFTQSRFESLRSEYVKMPRRAPRKKVRIKFDANGCPKVTKTPLDPQLSALFGYLKVTKSD